MSLGNCYIVTLVTQNKIFNENLSPCPPCDPWIFLVAYGKKSLEEIFNKNMAYGQKYIIGI